MNGVRLTAVGGTRGDARRALVRLMTAVLSQE